MVKYTTGSDLEITWIYRLFIWPNYPNFENFDFKGRFHKMILGGISKTSRKN